MDAPKLNLTVKEVAAKYQDVSLRRDWIREQSDPRKIQQLLHELPIVSYRDEHELGRMAIDILLAESAEEREKRFEQQMDRLLGITEAQRVLAAKLEQQTETVIQLTRALIWLTVAVVVLTALLLAKDFLTK
jgi:hypothetical protein